MLPFNALSNKPFIKFTVIADPSYSISFFMCLGKPAPHLHKIAHGRVIFDLQQAKDPILFSICKLSCSSDQTVNYTIPDSVFDDFPFLFISKTHILSRQLCRFDIYSHPFAGSGSHATDFSENRDGPKCRTG